MEINILPVSSDRIMQKKHITEMYNRHDILHYLKNKVSSWTCTFKQNKLKSLTFHGSVCTNLKLLTYQFYPLIKPRHKT